MTRATIPRPGGVRRTRAPLPDCGPAPVTNVERTRDAWDTARRREFAAAIVEDTFRRGYRVLVDFPPAVDVDSGERRAACLVLSPAGQVIHWRGSGHVPTSGPAPYVIAHALAAHVVARFDLTNLYVEGPTAWHPLPGNPRDGKPDWLPSVGGTSR